MAPPGPVPSRATLNALRGLVFTTSCSVILLAEERRRRTKVARTALDNARKLHTVKARRRPVAMLDTRLSEPELELLTMTRATDAPRRRKRQRSSSNQSLASSESKNSAEPRATTAAAPEGLASPANNAPSARGVLGDGATSSCTPDPYSALRAPAKSHLLSPLTPDLDTLRGAKALHRRLLTRLPSPQAQEAMRAAITKTTSKVLEAIKSGDASHMDPLTVEVLDYLAAPPRYDARGNPRSADAIPLLKRLLGELESPDSDATAVMGNQDMAMEIFKKVISLKPEMTGSTDTRRLRLNCLRLLKNIVNHDLDRLASSLELVLPLYKGLPQLIVPLLQWLVETNSREGIRRVLQYLSSHSQSEPTLDSSLIVELLDAHSRRYKSPSGTWRVYQSLQDAGLSDYIKRTDRGLHNLMAQQADLERTYTDTNVQGGFIANIIAGHSCSVETDLEWLEGIAKPQSAIFQSILANLIDNYVQRLPPTVLEEAIRTLADKYHMAVEKRWLYLVLDHHSSHIDLEAMLSWLQFCFQTGCRVDDAFIRRFYHRCRKHWMVGDEEMAQFYYSLREIDPSIPQPTTMGNSDSSVDSRTSHRKSPFTHEGWETMYLRSADMLRSGMGHHDAEDFKFMQTKAFRGHWESVWATYEENCAAKLRFSLRCLRLAVLARLKLDNGATERTSKLVWEIHAQGHDVSEVLTPLLMAQVAEGRDAIELVQDTLGRGLRIHDMVYNRAAQSASASGDQRGAVEICKTAASQNGNGDLLYNGYNFVNLVYGYVGLSYYQSLAALLSTFTAEKRWWAGNHVCKQAMKLAMKTVAKRAALADSRHAARPHEAALIKLNEAFLHGFKCKQFSDDRRELMDGFIEAWEMSKPGTAECLAEREIGESVRLEATVGGETLRKTSKPMAQTASPQRASTSHVMLKPREGRERHSAANRKVKSKMPWRPEAEATAVS